MSLHRLYSWLKSSPKKDFCHASIIHCQNRYSSITHPFPGSLLIPPILYSVRCLTSSLLVRCAPNASAANILKARKLIFQWDQLTKPSLNRGHRTIDVPDHGLAAKEWSYCLQLPVPHSWDSTEASTDFRTDLSWTTRAWQMQDLVFSRRAALLCLRTAEVLELKPLPDMATSEKRPEQRCWTSLWEPPEGTLSPGTAAEKKLFLGL